MDTSSYSQGIMVGGLLRAPDPFYIPQGIVVKQEVIGIPANAVSTIRIAGNVVSAVILPVNTGNI